MALTSTEEALVRQLLDQQAAILSLAGNESTITSKLGATKVTLADLVSASAVAEADLLLLRQGTTDKSVTPLTLRAYTQDGLATQKAVQAGDYNTSVAGGTADALTGDYTPNILALENGLTLFVRAAAANTTTTPTFSPDGLTAKTIVKGNNLALVAGDIAGAAHWLEMNFDSALDKWVLMNPAKGIVYVAQQPGEVCFFAQNTAPAGFLKANGATVSRAGYPALFAALVKSSTVTISIASPGVVTWAAHGRSANDPVKFTTTGALPTGLTAGTTYYVVGASITTNTFQVSATAGGAAINTSGTQSGVQTAIHAPFGDGDGSTTFTLPDVRGEAPRGWDDGRGVDTNRAFGSGQLDALQDHAHGNSGAGVSGDAGTYGVYAGNATIPGQGGIYTGAGYRIASETRMRNVALLGCIKY